MVADRGYTTRENIEEMAEREIDFLGSMKYVPRGANLPNQLPPTVFLYQQEPDRCVCPGGKILLRHPSQFSHTKRRRFGGVAGRDKSSPGRDNARWGTG